MTRKRQGLMLIGCVVAAAMALTHSVTFAAGKPVRRTIVVPAKTSLDVRLASAVASSDRERREDAVLASLVTPVIVDGVSVAPVSSVLFGSVVSETDSSQESGGRDVGLRFDRLRVGATTYDIHTAVIRIPHDVPATRFRLELVDPVSIDVQRLR